MYLNSISSPNSLISLRGLPTNSLYLKREDAIHPFVSGNKFRKLAYNVKSAMVNNCKYLVTFGGAYSNHIAAVAAAGEEIGIKTIGFIRGEELKDNYGNNPTLLFAEQCGMLFHFLSREEYRKKENSIYVKQFIDDNPDVYILPEGGTNALAVKGCKEILAEADYKFDYICVPVGTGGTLSGLVAAAMPHQKVIGYSALKGTFQLSEVKKYTDNTNFTIKDEYCFGGYAKIDSQLVRFMNSFKEQTEILLDPVYTAKMLFGIVSDIQNGYFPENSSILAIHTGGLQGISGMNQHLKKKKLPQIEI